MENATITRVSLSNGRICVRVRNCIPRASLPIHDLLWKAFFLLNQRQKLEIVFDNWMECVEWDFFERVFDWVLQYVPASGSFGTTDVSQDAFAQLYEKCERLDAKTLGMFVEKVVALRAWMNTQGGEDFGEMTFREGGSADGVGMFARLLVENRFRELHEDGVLKKGAAWSGLLMMIMGYYPDEIMVSKRALRQTLCDGVVKTWLLKVKKEDWDIQFAYARRFLMINKF